MRLTLAALLLATLPALAMAAPTAPAAVKPETASERTAVLPRVALETSVGRVVLELDPARAPQTVANFLAYVDAGDYNGTIVHRVVPNLLVQGGAYTPDLQAKPERAPVPLETATGVSHLRGTVAAARRPDRRDSATSQFFINVVDNPQFDAIDASNDLTAGYAVFGRVVEGMEVIDAMRNVETGAQGPFQSRVPKQPIIINRALRLGGQGG